jgi:6-methylsalicylate decarboxylase
MQALLGMTDPSRALYGSDRPFTPEFGVTRMCDSLEHNGVLNAAVLERVWSANARRLLPRLASSND